jgi:hypothetical protein
MNVSTYKDFVKSYSSLLVPVLIGVVGLLLFVPTRILGGKLREQMARGSLAKGRMLSSYSGPDTVSAQEWQKERAYQQAHGQDANAVELLVIQSGQRKLLSYEIFPEPKDDSVMIFSDFGWQLRHSVERLVADVNAGDCPTKAQLDGLKETWKSRRGSRRKSARKVELATIREGLCLQNAKSCSVYANPAVLGVYNFWDEYKYSSAKTKDEPIGHCWYSQLAYWIIEDVFHTIGTMNAGSKNVLTSPVKRLMDVSFPEVRAVGSRRGAATRGKSGVSDKPAYVLALEQLRSSSCTRRACHEDIDVVHFKTSVVLDSAAVLRFMKQLCSAKEHTFAGWDGSQQEQIFKHNQITILNYKITPVDRKSKSKEHKSYCYGGDAVIKLDLTCEYIFSKSSHAKIKPPAVTKGISEILQAIESKRALQNRRLQRLTRRKPKLSSTDLLE